MNSKASKQVLPHDFKLGQDRFRAEVLNGLRKAQKELPSKYFYDKQGSYLFERICALNEYYIPRTEAAIMETYAEEMIDLLGPRILLIEYGSGSCDKVRVLLDYLHDLVAYIPVDISREQLLLATGELLSAYSGLEVLPVCADYTSGFELPVPKRPNERKVVYFPGSTIGNFDPIPAKQFLERVAKVCGPGGALLIGIDLQKDPGILHRAYNDDHGITAAFNFNLLKRINRELDCNIRVEWFEHYAFYNPREGRVEMHLVSLRDQIVNLDGVTIPFTKGESIWTESSYKYTLDGFEEMATVAGFNVEHIWTDERQWFSVQYLVSTIDMTV
ncbi:L-histidine N(alpha)-methyltransferase [Chloroflexota bacterium]